MPAARLGPAAEAGDTASTGSADTRSPASAAAAIRRYVFLIAFLYLLIGNGRDEGGARRARVLPRGIGQRRDASGDRSRRDGAARCWTGGDRPCARRVDITWASPGMAERVHGHRAGASLPELAVSEKESE
ncbi:hypothetical protein Raf01_56720 [Rugosimonospora africana]|uniref:Uncharacterized protein n=1 Tax=Rugosimonospora africana TaxID=556532 RepID=A0A8J3VSU4_9ACTN|nr:hypothetical protein Raf01_56720 [Rugosimonospora africana]